VKNILDLKVILKHIFKESTKTRNNINTICVPIHLFYSVINGTT
jgi:hypothetical protein